MRPYFVLGAVGALAPIVLNRLLSNTGERVLRPVGRLLAWLIPPSIKDLQSRPLDWEAEDKADAALKACGVRKLVVPANWLFCEYGRVYAPHTLVLTARRSTATS